MLVTLSTCLSPRKVYIRLFEIVIFALNRLVHTGHRTLKISTFRFHL